MIDYFGTYLYSKYDDVFLDNDRYTRRDIKYSTVPSVAKRAVLRKKRKKK